MPSRLPLPRHRSSHPTRSLDRNDYTRSGDALLPRVTIHGAYVYPDGWWLLLDARALDSGAPDVRHVELATIHAVYRQQITYGWVELDDATDKDLRREADELPGLTAQRLRELPVTLLAADLLARHGMHTQPGAWLGEVGPPDHIDADGTRWWRAAGDQRTDASTTAERATRHRRRTVTPATLERVSATCMAAWSDGQPFTPAVADELGVSPRTAEAWVRRARDSGYPMPPDPRRKDPHR